MKHAVLSLCEPYMKITIGGGCQVSNANIPILTLGVNVEKFVSPIFTGSAASYLYITSYLKLLRGVGNAYPHITIFVNHHSLRQACSRSIRGCVELQFGGIIVCTATPC